MKIIVVVTLLSLSCQLSAEPKKKVSFAVFNKNLFKIEMEKETQYPYKDAYKVFKEGLSAICLPAQQKNEITSIALCLSYLVYDELNFKPEQLREKAIISRINKLKKLSNTNIHLANYINSYIDSCLKLTEIDYDALNQRASKTKVSQTSARHFNPAVQKAFHNLSGKIGIDYKNTNLQPYNEKIIVQKLTLVLQQAKDMQFTPEMRIHIGKAYRRVLMAESHTDLKNQTQQLVAFIKTL